ncbi:MAG TPA: S8 family serine peptidase [Longimicrobiaceae bacterium]|nr:S8 family serine peptidase [Longimicrobiaceae bacterium]
MKPSSTILRTLAIVAIAATAACDDAREPVAPVLDPSHALVSANDEHFGLQWGLRQIGAPAAWSVSTGRKQVIAIVDTGVDLGHPDLQAKLVPGATFTGCADTGPCGNGDWKSGTPEAQAEGFHPHGTHVAGIAAAITGNGRGIAGVAPAAKIMPVKVLTDSGGSFPEIAAGIRWAADNGADVINLSLGALPGVQLLPFAGELADAKNAINYAVSKGVVVVAAAGNDFASICGEPSFSPNALCVVATDSLEQRAAYSNFALQQNLNVVAAPGGAALLSCAEDIISTVPVEAEGTCTGTLGTPGGYDVMAGTSMAAPHVAGVAALLTAQGRDVFQVYEVLKRTARTPVTGLRGFFTPTHGYGIVDAAAAVAALR